MVDKSTKAICPFFCKSGDMRIKCEGFCEEVVKLTLEFETKKQRQMLAWVLHCKNE